MYPSPFQPLAMQRIGEISAAAKGKPVFSQLHHSYCPYTINGACTGQPSSEESFMVYPFGKAQFFPAKAYRPVSIDKFDSTNS